MSKTKAEILDTARELFNKHGISKVPLRAISEKMGISPGNLTYHFKKKSDITQALYYEFVAMATTHFENLDSTRLNLQLLHRVVDSLTQTRVKYSFFVQDLVVILRDYPAIRKHYLRTLRGRKNQFTDLIKELISKGILRKPELPDEYELFYERIQLLGSFWISSASIFGQKPVASVIARNQRMILQSIYPYLTASGRKEWKQLPLA